MGRWKPSVVYLRGPGSGPSGFVRTLRSVRIRLRPVSAPELHAGVDRNQVDVAWDYMAFPVWGRVGASFDLDSAIDEVLRDDLQKWSDRVTGATSGHERRGATEWEWPSDEVIEQFNIEGAALARRLQEVLGPDATVTYQPI